MYLCVCNAVTENDIRQAVASGARNFAAVCEATGCSTCCGCCEPVVRELVDCVAAETRPSLKLVVSHAA